MKYIPYKITESDYKSIDASTSLVRKCVFAYSLSKEVEELKSPFTYKDMDKVREYILEAINDNKKIMIYGDYDVDGITSVSILKKTFNELGKEVGYYIPNRYKDGYGITSDMVQEIAKKGYNLLITIDNGINALEPLELAKNAGIETIIIDHHELIKDIPLCKYYLHPQLSNFSDYNMCAASIAYYLSQALLGYKDVICSILAGVGTISDVMPLIGQNKRLVIDAINYLKTIGYPNLDILKEKDDEYNENVLSMQIIPKLNSVGRIRNDNSANRLVTFLLSKNESEIRQLARFILESNTKRKELSDEFYKRIKVDDNDLISVTKDDKIPEGICGLIASRVTSTYHIPSLVFSNANDKSKYVGSARSVDGINITEVLSRIDYLVSFGGHNKAAGVTINASDYKRFNEDITAIISSYKKVEAETFYIKLNEDELSYKAYEELLEYAPFGEANPYPIFGLEHLKKESITFSKDHKHIFFRLNENVSIVGFNLSSVYDEKKDEYRAIFTLDKNNLYKVKLSCKCLTID